MSQELVRELSEDLQRHLRLLADAVRAKDDPAKFDSLMREAITQTYEVSKKVLRAA